jgi:hypothetical protein
VYNEEGTFISVNFSWAQTDVSVLDNNDSKTPLPSHSHNQRDIYIDLVPGKLFRGCT